MRLTHRQPGVNGLLSTHALENSGSSEQALTREDALGHVMMVTDGVSWCFKCGALSSEKIHGRGIEGDGIPRNAQHYRFRQLKPNRHPVSNHLSTGSAKRLRIAEQF